MIFEGSNFFLKGGLAVYKQIFPRRGLKVKLIEGMATVIPVDEERNCASSINILELSPDDFRAKTSVFPTPFPVFISADGGT